MNQAAWRLFWASAWNNKSYVLAYSILDGVFLLASAIFAVAIALYFGLDAVGFYGPATLFGMLENQRAAIGLASAMATLALLARILHGAMEAKVTSDRELWLARRIRERARQQDFDLTNAARASNHYGRLSAASMKAVSTMIILAISVVALPAFVSPSWAVPLLLTFALVAVILTLVARLISTRMKNSSLGIAEHGRALAIWKMNPSEEEREEVSLYASAYYQRIFLSSIFGYAPLLFVTLFSFALLGITLLGTELKLGEFFVGFVLAQAYLGLLGRMFTNIVKSAAFIPAILKFSSVVETGNTHRFRATPAPAE